MRWRDIGERADRLLASPRFFAGFNLALVSLLCISVDDANLFISIVTAEAVLLGAALARASWHAVHAKLDELLAAVRGAREELIRAEERDEAEIGDLRR